MKLLGGPRNISGNASLLLDSLRIAAAMTVFIGHAYDQWHYPFGGHGYTMLDNVGHASVVVFFVLSGYVIAHTTTGNNRGRLQYAQARLSRLYSVVIPALVLTIIAQFILYYSESDLLAHYSRGQSWPRYIVSSLFLNEIWFFSAAPPINGPLWSLSFEFWYYVIFGAWFYKTSGWKGLIIPIVACLIAGPKILAMMPIWLLGNLAYRLRRPDSSVTTNWLIILLLFILVGVLIMYLPYMPGQIGTPPLFFAAQFLTDWAIGLVIALALWLLPSGVSPNKSVKNKLGFVELFRKIADLTFPIYVLHDPLLILWRSLFGSGDGNKNMSMIGALIVTFLLCVLIGSYLDGKRYLWINLFKKILYYGRSVVKKRAYEKV